MKNRRTPVFRDDARNVLASCKVPIGADFDSLSSGQVDLLLAMADVRRYRKPRDANGSRGRFFHDLMQRRARSEAVR